MEEVTAMLLCPPDAVVRAFFEKVRRSDSGCLEWTGATARFGYGCIRIKRKLYSAHRLSYQWFVGPVAADQVVRHTCDNPPCVNPHHLRVGTHGDNVHDTIARGRKVQVRGERIGTAKLTVDKVREIRRLAESGELSQRAIGRQFGVSHTVIQGIVRRRFWTHVGDAT